MEVLRLTIVPRIETIFLMDNQIPTPPQNIPVEAPQPSPPASPENSNRSFVKTLGIGLSIVSFCIALAVGGYLLGSNKNALKSVAQVTPTPTPTPTPDPTASWKTYNNFGFSIKYPDKIISQTDGSSSATDFYKDVPIVYFTKGITIKVFDKTKGTEYEIASSYFTKLDHSWKPITIGNYQGKLFYAPYTTSPITSIITDAWIATLSTGTKTFYFQLYPLNKSSITEEEFYSMLSTFKFTQ